MCEVVTCVALGAGAEERANMSKRVAKPRITPYVPYSERRNERCWRWSGNRQTDTHTHARARTRTQDKYHNPSAHARKDVPLEFSHAVINLSMTGKSLNSKYFCGFWDLN